MLQQWLPVPRLICNIHDLFSGIVLKQKACNYTNPCENVRKPWDLKRFFIGSLNHEQSPTPLFGLIFFVPRKTRSTETTWFQGGYVGDDTR